MTMFRHTTDHTDDLPELFRQVEHNAVPQPSEAFVQQELDKLVAWMSTPARPTVTPPVTSPPAEDIRFLDIAEAATLLRVSKLTVYRLVHSGDLPAVRTDRAWYVPLDATLAYLDTHDAARYTD